MSEEVEEFVSHLPKIPTPNNAPEDLFEIEHTGPYNFLVSGGGTKVFIDGYRGRTILESKYVKNADRSPFVSGSSIPSFLRNKILQQVRDELQRISNVIKDPSNPFDSLEIIVNNSDAKSFFESWLQELDISGTVVIPEE